MGDLSAAADAVFVAPTSVGGFLDFEKAVYDNAA